VNKYIKYLQYVLRHKWYVMIECFKEGLIWRGIIHDLSKFSLGEFIPYANYFYGKKGNNIKRGRNKTGHYKAGFTGEETFDFAWLLHQKRNRHHWQWWILPEDEGGTKILPMEENYLREMICDWVGAGKAQGHFSPKDDKYLETRNWYKQNSSKVVLHKKTRQKIESLICL